MDRNSLYNSSVNNAINSYYAPPHVGAPSYHDPSSFRSLEIFPKKQDLIGHRNIQLVPNIIDGAYRSVEDYLNLQFRLLREDCFGPLSEGIDKYMRNPSQQKYENIRVFPNVRVVRVDTSRSKVGYLINIAWNEKNNNGSVNCKKYADNKWFMCGSLCLFTADNFQNILCASVLDSSLELLRSGFILVTFESPVSSEIFKKQYLMIESEVFFEPYHRVLKVLQNSGSDIPMSRYIVDVQKETRPPAYLSRNIMYRISHKYNKISFPVLITHQWPSENFFNFDNSQLEAYKLALTREFAVIQGPPGTGKTFLGIKIVSTLLCNLSLSGTPILIISLTNHALDQFLEGILKQTNAIVRLGSQSKSKVLEPYNLNNLRLKMKTKYSRDFAMKRSELDKIFYEITKIQTCIKKSKTELIDYVTLKPYLKIDGKVLELYNWNENPLLHWLLERINDMDLVEKMNDLRNASACLSVIYKIDKCWFKEWALKRYGGQEMFVKFQNTMKRIERINPCKTYVTSAKIFMEMHSYNLYKLNFFERWQLYFKAVEDYKDCLSTRLRTLLDRYNVESAKLEELRTLLDIELMRSTRVVGLTTTVAARRHDLCNKLRSPIVIVEEAAEILEAHVVASLTRNCQHLILIGDHKQLRPSAAHYKLSKHYNLEISLFERMIRNDVHSTTLTTQRRMRPNFVQLLVPTIYDRLDCHPDVLKYPPVNGMKDTLFFFNHNTLEDPQQGSETSYKNSFEARWCAALANYLRKMNYKPNEITILTTYNAQAALIKEISKKYHLLDEVKITVVDNYQGEENRIIILSLVRSNRERKIGFLSAANRVCVALSRAREGFYMFGNMNVLESASPIWRLIHGKLKAQNAIGDAITVMNYKDTLVIKNVGELDKLAKINTLSDYIDIQLGMAVLFAMFASYVYSLLFELNNKFKK